MESRISEVNSLLKVGMEGVSFVGIWRMGSIGKTTIARELFDNISWQFEGSCFLANVREVSNKHGLEHLQKILLSQILKLDSVKIASVYEGIDMIKTRFRFMKVLIVLDDVVNEEQLENLVGKRDWFGNGSRIITTTRDCHLISQHDCSYEVTLLAFHEALHLFCWHAFKSPTVVKELEELSNHVVNYAKGLPLALKVFGSFLYGRDDSEWVSALNRIRDTGEGKIVKQLRLSYDVLSAPEKKLFLDVACFSRGKKKADVIKILDSFGLHADIGIHVLAQKSLLIITEGIVEMHDLVQGTGWLVVCEDDPEEPGNYSRLWRAKDI